MANDGPESPHESSKNVDERLSYLEAKSLQDGLDEEELAELERIAGTHDDVLERDEFSAVDEGIRRLETLKDNVRVDPNDPLEDPAFRARFEQISQRVKETAERRQQEEIHQMKIQREQISSAQGAGVGMTIFYSIIGLPLFGYGIGYVADRMMKTENYRNIGFMVFLVMGLIFAIYIIQRQNEKNS